MKEMKHWYAIKGFENYEICAETFEIRNKRLGTNPYCDKWSMYVKLYSITEKRNKRVNRYKLRPILDSGYVE